MKQTSRKKKLTPRQAQAQWDEFYSSFVSNADVNMNEPPEERERRRTRLERDPEAWMAYYCARYCTSKPADFHRRATRRLLSDANCYEVRAWSRELAKSARSMMEVLYLALTGKIRNVLVVSNSYDNAERLLDPFRLQLERDLRITLDYGVQVVDGKWESGEFTAGCGCSFRALGAGQSPRGTRNSEVRPDFILIDDIDTDEACRNPERVKQTWDWVESALLPTRSISRACRVLFNGNVIAQDCCITRAMKMATHTDVVNIRDKQGRSTWPEKNSEADIDRILSQISTRVAQQEYFNNPLSEGDVFKTLTWDKVPPLSRFRFLVAYGDPAPSNNKSKQSSTKCVVLCGLMKGVLYVVDCRLDRGLNSEFIDWFAQLDRVADGCTVYNIMENNTLQDPFYQQVFKPLVAEKRKEIEKESGRTFSVGADTKKKTDKATRIEANLEPLVSSGRLVMNIAEKNNPHMKRLEEQFLMFSLALKYPADGPDCVEGALRWLRDKSATTVGADVIPTADFRRRNKQRL